MQTGTIRKLGCCLLFAFYSNYGHILTVYETFSGKGCVALKTGLEVVQGH